MIKVLLGFLYKEGLNHDCVDILEYSHVLVT